VRARRRRREAARLPTCRELVCTPELGILASIEMALDVALVALVAAQPELQPTADPYDAVSTTAAAAADHVIVCAQALAAAIAAYRAALREPPNDLHF
jgi:hypothetical protein